LILLITELGYAATGEANCGRDELRDLNGRSIGSHFAAKNSSPGFPPRSLQEAGKEPWVPINKRLGRPFLNRTATVLDELIDEDSCYGPQRINGNGQTEPDLWFA